MRFAVLAAVPFVMVLGNSMLIPVFPQMRAAMDLTQFQVGLIVTAFSIPAAIVIPFAGVLSDYIGRKAIMAPALILYGLGGLVAGTAALLLANPYPVILGGRLLQGIGAGGTYLLAMALTGDIFTTKERSKALGLLEAANGFGKVVSPVLGAAVALLIWFAPFFVYGFLALPVAFLVWFIVKEPPMGNARKRGLKRYGRSLAHIYRQRGGPLITSYGVGMAALFLLFGILAFLSDDLEQRFGVAGFGTGLLLAIPVTTMAITAYAAGVFLQDRISLLKPTLIGGLILAGGALALTPLLAANLAAFMGMIGVLGIGIGAILPALNMLITSAAAQRERGVITSLYGTVRFTGVALGPPAFAIAVQWGRPTMFLAAAGLAVAAALLSWVLIDPARLMVATQEDEKQAS